MQSENESELNNSIRTAPDGSQHASGYVSDLARKMYHLAELGIRIWDAGCPIVKTLNEGLDEEDVRQRYEAGPSVQVPDLVGRAVCEAVQRNPDCPNAIEVAMSEYEAAAAAVPGRTTQTTSRTAGLPQRGGHQ